MRADGLRLNFDHQLSNASASCLPDGMVVGLGLEDVVSHHLQNGDWMSEASAQPPCSRHASSPAPYCLMAHRPLPRHAPIPSLLLPCNRLLRQL